MRTLRRRFTLLTMATTIGLVLLFALTTVLAVGIHLLDAARASAVATAETVGDSLPLSLAGAGPYGPTSMRDFTELDDPRVWVYTGHRLRLFSPNTAGRPPRRRAGLSLFSARPALFASYRTAGDRTIVVGEPLAADRDLMTDLVLVLGLGALGAAALAFLLADWSTRRTLGPIGEMTRAAEGMLERGEAGPLTVFTGAPDEFTHLSEVLTRLVNMLERGRRREREFLAEAAHQLRTPLAVIAGNVALISGWGAADETVRSDSLEAMQRATADMTTLVNDLLTLEHATQDPPRALNTVDLAEVIAEVGADARALSPELDVRVAPVETLMARADPMAVRRALWAVVENALHYTPAGGTVTIEGRTRDGRVEICVADTGPGIPAEELPKVLGRFYRGRTTRSRPGTGLGLAIASALLTSQEGGIHIASEEGRGTTVTLWLNGPRSDPRRGPPSPA